MICEMYYRGVLWKYFLPNASTDSLLLARRRCARPRSPPLPPNPGCDHHEEGNAQNTTVVVDKTDITQHTSSFDAGPRWSHVHATLFFDNGHFATEFWRWLEVDLNKTNVILYQHRTKKTRSFIFGCCHCNETGIVVYDEWTHNTIVEACLHSLARFTKRSQPEVLGSCHALVVHGVVHGVEVLGGCCVG